MDQAAFSSGVNYISIVLNSTLHPILELYEGGGLNLTEFQLVDYIASKCAVVSSSLTNNLSLKITILSLKNKIPKWFSNL